MKLEVLPDVKSVARAGAAHIAEQARIAIAERGRFIFGVSGGKTPWIMLRDLARESLMWSDIDIVQVDERIARSDHPDRNLTALRESLTEAPLSPRKLHAMPVEAFDLAAAARMYAKQLQEIAGSPPVLDLVHLGLGEDGHTASLIPDDPVLDVSDADVSLTEEYRGHRRMTLTYAMLNRLRRILWVVTGADKAAALRRLLDGDTSIPAGRVRRDSALVLADNAAAARL